MHAYVYFSVAGNQAMDRKKKKSIRRFAVVA